jgi:HEAT repeat protein
LLRVVQHDAANGWLAANALGRIDVEGLSVPVLIDKLAGRDAQMRRFAALGLSRMGRKASAAADMLYQGVRDPDQAARIAAAQAYWSVSGQADDAVRVLRSELAGSSDWKAQMWAADALAEIGPAAQAAVPELMARLSSDTRYVVTSSAEALGKIGPAAVPARPALTARLRDADDFYTRVCIARALWRINRSEEALPVLHDALANSRDFMAVSEAAEAVGDMGPEAAGSETLLRPLLKEGDPFVRKAAADALKQLEAK